MSSAPGLEALDPTRLEAVSLDVGGVLVIPDQDLLADALRRAGVVHDRRRFTEAHYRAMAEVDRCLSVPEEFTDYHRGFLRAVGTPDSQLEAGAVALAEVLDASVWHQRIPGGVAAAKRLARAGLRLGVTSNSDGRVEELLRHHGVAQIGEGPGVPVDVITDSGVLGAHKPDPAMFLTTATGLGLPPGRICHIGDSAYYDVEGAAAVGMVAVHVDPLGLCRGAHLHARSLADLADRLAGPGGISGEEHGGD